MSTMAMASSLNPNAPLFVPAAYRRVEDFSPEWWDLVQTTAWFRDHWFRQHQLHEARHDAALAALPDDLLDTDRLFYAPDHHLQQYQQEPSSDADAAVLRTLTRGVDPSPWEQQQPRYADKPAQHAVGLKDPARRVIHQPR